MRIAVVGTEVGGGGAGRALWRSVAALAHRGHDVDVLHVSRNRITPNSIVIDRAPIEDSDAMQGNALARLEHHYINPRRSALSDTLFTADTCGYDIAVLPFLRDYDLINIHWTSFFLSVENIGDIIALGRPVVFTLHDVAYFTGGCHYTAGCTEYLRSCAGCPQLTPDTLGLASQTLALKQTFFNKPNVAVVAPSAWLTKCAAESRVFTSVPCHHVSNAIETDVFRPLDREAARNALGLQPDDHAILFGAYNGKERRKGFRHMIAALEALRDDPRAVTALAAGRVKILTFGAPPEEVVRTNMPVLPLGFIDSDAVLAEVYNAADALVLPSIEDNQPNVMLESLACGTPVICFRIGGQPDLVRDGQTGFAAPPFDVRALAARLGDVLFDQTLASTLRANAAAIVRKTATPEIVGRQLEAVFLQLAAKVDAPRAAVPAPMPANGHDGGRSAEARLRYVSALLSVARDLPPVEPPAPPPPPPPPPELSLEEHFEAFHAARDHMLGELRLAPEGQLRAAFRLTRTSAGRRGGLAALALPILRSYAWNWETVVAIGRRSVGYGAALIRSLGRKVRITRT